MTSNRTKKGHSVSVPTNVVERDRALVEEAVAARQAVIDNKRWFERTSILLSFHRMTPAQQLDACMRLQAGFDE